MDRFRTHLTALLGGTILLALSVAGALGAAPWADAGTAGNRGLQVAAFVHSLSVGDEDVAEEEPADGDEPTDETQDTEDTQDAEQSEPGAHGACVSEVAMGEDVGGPNENHGGAVSEAARVTCWEASFEEPTEDEATDESAHDRTHGRSGDHH